MIFIYDWPYKSELSLYPEQPSKISAKNQSNKRFKQYVNEPPTLLSRQKFMIEPLFMPHTFLVKHQDFTSRFHSENHINIDKLISMALILEMDKQDHILKSKAI